ncbi:hypothetical protein JWH04_16425 [Xanthomonas melonis]|uniref:Cro/CI family transcriptional regulator n=1 Tax=Xanthomonas melonis TaxID=56456 RepID=UPI001E392A52|nr:Cro/CI family transcriptional regulator [Xanthomonas melonis]MCD0280497.1 hypothetical protein [Xanthomonas melonis]
MNEPITKRSAREALGFSRDVELAKFFGTTKQAVSAWPEDRPLPEGRQWQARAIRPDVFGPPPANPDATQELRDEAA